MADYDSYLGTCSGDVIGDRVVERFKNFRQQLESNGLMRQWRRNFSQAHNGPSEVAKSGGWEDFGTAGEDSEIMSVRLPLTRELLTHQHNLAYSQPVGLRAIASNSSPDAIEAAEVQDALLQNDFDDQNGGEMMRSSGFAALITGTNFIDVEWDLFAGANYITDPKGNEMKTGAPKYSERWVDEVEFDISIPRWVDVYRNTVLCRENRYKLASQFPDHERAILDAPALKDSELASVRYMDDDSDDIVFLRFMHRPFNSRLLPVGRLTLVLEDGTVLRDGDSPYATVNDGKFTLHPITSTAGMRTVYGYPVATDLAPIQEWLNVCASMMATLVAAFGAPNVVGPPMDMLNVEDLVGGGRYFGVPMNQGKVELLNLLPDLAPMINTLQLIESFGEKRSGMNAMIRGDVGDESSGKKVALVKSMAVQFMSGYQQSIVRQHVNVANSSLSLRQAFGTGEQTVEKLGEGKVSQTLHYNREKLRLVKQVRAEAVDPVATTPEGREERAWAFMERGMVRSPRQFFTLVKTGRDEPMYDAETAINGLILRENERLRNGQPQMVIAEDEHEDHILQHKALISDPEARDNPELMAIVLDHIALHQMFLAGVTPLQGEDENGQPYPPPDVQWKQHQAQMRAEQAAMAQAQSMTGQPQEGEQSSTGAPAQQGGSEPPKSVPINQAMQQSAQGPQQ